MAAGWTRTHWGWLATITGHRATVTRYRAGDGSLTYVARVDGLALSSPPVAHRRLVDAKREAQSLLFAPEEPETSPQEAAVDDLVANGWTVDRADGGHVYLSKRNAPRRGYTLYAEVSPDGRVNGKDLRTFWTMLGSVGR